MQTGHKGEEDNVRWESGANGLQRKDDEGRKLGVNGPQREDDDRRKSNVNGP